MGGGGGNKVRIEVCTNACRSKAVGRTVGQKQYCVLSLKYTPSQVTMYVLQTIPNDVFERLQDLERAAEGWTYPNEQATSDNL